jgi:hypothetical protein
MKKIHGRSGHPRQKWFHTLLLASGVACLTIVGCGERRGWSSSGSGSSSGVAYQSSGQSAPAAAPSTGGDPAYPSLPAPEMPRSMRSSPSRRGLGGESGMANVPRESQSTEVTTRPVPVVRSSPAAGATDVPAVTELKRPPGSDKEETLRAGRSEQPLEVARADALPESSRPGEDRSVDRRPDENEKASRPEPKRAPPQPVDGTYRIQAGDDLDLVFVERWTKGTEYRLLPGDQIRVEFILGADGSGAQRSPLDRTVRLQPDGMISLPYIGVVSASGVTVRELSQQLTSQYQDLYVNPNILVSLVATGGGLEELQRALSSAGGRTTRVAPDGTIMVPFLGSVQAEKLALVELEEEMNERFRRAAPGFGVMVRLAGRP